MKKLLTTVAVLTVVATPALAQGYDPASRVGAAHSEKFYTIAYREDARAHRGHARAHRGHARAYRGDAANGADAYGAYGEYYGQYGAPYPYGEYYGQYGAPDWYGATDRYRAPRRGTPGPIGRDEEIRLDPAKGDIGEN